VTSQVAAVQPCCHVNELSVEAKVKELHSFLPATMGADHIAFFFSPFPVLLLGDHNRVIIRNRRMSTAVSLRDNSLVII
jgi:hypothetical protein